MNSYLKNAIVSGDLQRVEKLVQKICGQAALLAAANGHFQIVEYFIDLKKIKGREKESDEESDEEESDEEESDEEESDEEESEEESEEKSEGCEEGWEEGCEEGCEGCEEGCEDCEKGGEDCEEDCEGCEECEEECPTFQQLEALRLAAKNGHLETVKHLVNSGAAVGSFDEDSIVFAAENGHLEIVEYLASQGADIRVHDDRAIVFAAMNGHLEIVEFLASQGADIKNDHEVALSMAAENGHLETVEFLVSEGCSCHLVLRKNERLHNELKSQGLCTCNKEIKFQEKKCKEQTQCIICHDDLFDLFIIPCDSKVNHLVCGDCKSFVKKECPMCRFEF